MERDSIVETEFCLSDEDPTTPTVRDAPHNAERRQQLVSDGVDKAILTVLDYKIQLGLRTYKLLDVTGPLWHNLDTGQPVYAVLLGLQHALDRHHLPLDKKRTLFEILGWKFECLACKQVKVPADFQGTSYIFWGAESPARAHLRSGPCVTCTEQARKSNHPQSALLAYKVTFPPG